VSFFYFANIVRKYWTGKGGAFTGETSAEQLADVGVKWVVAGHAERRHILGETNAIVASKAAFALSQGLSVIIAFGETLDERDMGITNDVLFEQLQASDFKFSKFSIPHCPHVQIDAYKLTTDVDSGTEF